MTSDDCWRQLVIIGSLYFIYVHLSYNEFDFICWMYSWHSHLHRWTWCLPMATYYIAGNTSNCFWKFGQEGKCIYLVRLIEKLTCLPWFTAGLGVSCQNSSNISNSFLLPLVKCNTYSQLVLNSSILAANLIQKYLLSIIVLQYFVVEQAGLALSKKLNIWYSYIV